MKERYETVKQEVRERLLFFLRLLASPRRMGSITPSSRYLVRTLIERSNIADATLVVELGPGTGPFTSGLLARLRRDALLVCIERDSRLAEHLRHRFSDPRLRVVTGDAVLLEQYLRDLHLDRPAPLIVSGLPFTSLPARARDDILAVVRRCLAPDGVFLLYQYSPVLRSLLRRNFREVEITWEARNLPPAFCFRCRP